MESLEPAAEADPRGDAPPADPPPVAELEPGPPWIADLFALWKREILEFLTTAVALLRRPRRFGDEWSRGEFHAMPPIAFVLASATVLLPLDYGIQQTLQWDAARKETTLAVDIARGVKPIVLAILLGLGTHGILRLFGSRRRTSTTMGIVIYGAAVGWSLWCVGLLVSAITGAGDGVPNLTSAATAIWLALALEGVHRIKWWWCAAATIVTGFPVLVVVNLSLHVAGLS